MSAHSRCIQFGLFEFSPENNELRKQGLKLKVGHTACKTLALLLSEPGRVFSREELQRELWPAGVFVNFDQGLNKSIHALRLALNDSASSPRFIETVAGAGYRFLPAMSGSAELPSPRVSRRIDSVAVLPFATPVETPSLRFLASQITLQLINAISRMPGVHILAYSTVRHCDVGNRSLTEIGRNLGVRAMLVGELVHNAGELLLNVEFIDHANGYQLWGDRLRLGSSQNATTPEPIVEEILRDIQPIILNARSKLFPIPKTQVEW